MHNSSSPHGLAAWQGEMVETIYQHCSAKYLNTIAPKSQRKERQRKQLERRSRSLRESELVKNEEDFLLVSPELYLPEAIQYLVKNHPLPITLKQTLQIRVILSLLTAIFILVPLCYIPAAFVAFLVKERVSKSKHLQIVSGVSPYLYWLATYLWDLTLFIVLVGFIIIALFIFGQSKAAVFIGSAQSALCIVCLLLTYGAAVLPLCYLYSFYFINYSTAQISITVINFFTGFVMVMAYYVMANIPKTASAARALVNFFRLFPPYNIGEGLINLSTTYFVNTLYNRHLSLFSWTVCGRSLVFLFVEAIGFFLAVLLSESEFFQVAFQWTLKKTGLLQRYQPLPPPLPETDIDSDIVKEEGVVKEIMTRKSQGQPIESDNKVVLLLDHLIKTYPTIGIDGSSKPKFAVRGVSLACYEGERFGLLGINGAGKTTTLGVLTAEIQLTAGEVYIGGKPLSDPTTQRMIGYCPQVDPLLDLMTGYETLWFFGKIRGISDEILTHRIENLIRETGLTPYANVPCGKYSGGNKRKLSLAVALVGDPKVLLLDEPSTGMDPQARRHMWTVIEQVSTNRTVVLVSHSMEEIEALCTRVGVMVSGRMQCLGSVQHLKSKFGGGYLVEVRCDKNRIDECLQFCYQTALKTEDATATTICSEQPIEEEKTGLKESATDANNNNAQPTLEITLEESHGGYFRLKVGKGMDLAKAFDAFESEKDQGRIFDYNISQFSLEQVFINLARQQEEEPAKYFGRDLLQQSLQPASSPPPPSQNPSNDSNNDNNSADSNDPPKNGNNLVTSGKSGGSGRRGGGNGGGYALVDSEDPQIETDSHGNEMIKL